MAAVSFRIWLLVLGAAWLAAPKTLAQTLPRQPGTAPGGRPTRASGPVDVQWYLLDSQLDNVPGIGATRAYDELLQHKAPVPVVVAVIDSGIDTAHADLKPALWRNPREIPGNRIDDDRNGYVDDVHGWNFLGGADGRNLADETLELTRIVAAGRARFLGKTPDEVPAVQRAEFDLFQQADALYVAQARIAAQNPQPSNALNLSFNRRADIVKDDPTDLLQRRYGNADVQGPSSRHGTHVAGIIAAVRDNELGAQGIAGPAVRIMAVRVVPTEGDERDKDVANAIRYAVDNGAQIINMSFGKPFSPQRAAVDAAFAYAAGKNVLLVHAAGNEHHDLAQEPYYPAARSVATGQPFPNLLTVGASSARAAALAAAFSNYSQQQVDVFAPGVGIYSTLPGSTYGNESGTSMAAPVTAGVAAVLRSYFPKLTAADLKRIIMQSAQVHHTKVRVPGGRRQVEFAALSVSGGVVNMYEAVKLAQAMSE